MASDEFDEARYLRANPDVSVMLERGIFRSALEHWKTSGANEHVLGYRRSGFLEHDLIYDEKAYLAQNEDVARLLRARSMGSGYEHWMRFGRTEFARGRRWGPFAAKSGRVRPHCIPVANRGALIVATAPGELGTVTAVQCRIGTEPPMELDPANLACTEPLTLVDACEQTLTLRLLVCWIPGEVATDRGVRPVTVSLSSQSSAALVLGCPDAGKQAFFFPTIDDANRLVLAAKALVAADDERAERPARILDFVIERIRWSVWAQKETRPFAGVHVEQLHRSAGVGFHASGWLLPADSHLERLRVWCPETGECETFHDRFVRVHRPDVRAQLSDELITSPDEPLGFTALLPLPEASTTASPRLLFGITVKGGGEKWVLGNVEGALGHPPP